MAVGSCDGCVHVVSVAMCQLPRLLLSSPTLLVPQPDSAHIVEAVCQLLYEGRLGMSRVICMLVVLDESGSTSVIQSFSHSVIQSFSHSVIQSFSHSVIQSFSHSVIQSFSHSVIQSFSHSVIQSQVSE